MVKRKAPANPDDETEVDEVSESLDPHNLEAFVEQQFGEVDVPLNAQGMPSLAWIKKMYKTKSAAIRFLVHQGYQIKDIAKHLGIPYQHARNVAKQPLKRGPNEDWRNPGKSMTMDWMPQTEEEKNDE